MKKLSLFLLAAILFIACSDDDKDIVHVLDLPTYTTAETQDLGDTENPDKDWEEDFGGGFILKYYQTTLTDNNNIFAFDCISSDSYGFAYGFQFTNLTEGNYSAITKKGVTNNTYVTAGTTSKYNVSVKFLTDDATSSISPTKNYTIDGMYVTNSFYAYDVMENGNAFASKFGEDDWFKLTIYTADESKKVETYLADFREGKSEIIKTWQWVDLKSLGTTNGLKFELTSSDNGDYGMNTPAYFCLDGIKLIERE